MPWSLPTVLYQEPDALRSLSRRKIDPQTMAARRIFEHRAMDGFVASTTAIQIGNEMWLGSQRGDRIALVHQHQTAYYRIEGLVRSVLVQISLDKGDVF